MAAIVADHALGHAGGAGGVENIQRIGGGDRRARRALAGGHRVGAQRRPIMVAAFDQVGLELRALQDDAGLRLMRGERDRLVEQRLVGHDAVDFDAAGRRQDQLRLGVVDAGGELLGGEAAEHHRMHRAEPRAGQHADHRLMHHRHVDDDAVALADAEIGEHGGERLHLVEQFAIGEFGDGAGGRRIVDQRQLVGAAAFDVAVERVVAGVDDAVGEPAAVDALAAVERLGRRLDPVDLARRLAPESLGIGQASGHGPRDSGCFHEHSWRRLPKIYRRLSPSPGFSRG